MLWLAPRSIVPKIPHLKSFLWMQIADIRPPQFRRQPQWGFPNMPSLEFGLHPYYVLIYLKYSVAHVKAT